MKLSISALLLASLLALGTAPAQAAGISVAASRGLYYRFQGQRIPLQVRDDAIAVAFTPQAKTRSGNNTPLYQQLQTSLNSGTRGAEKLQVSPMGQNFAIIATPANVRGDSQALQNRIEQQPIVAAALPVLSSRSDRSDIIVLNNEIIVSLDPGLDEAQQQAVLEQQGLEVIRPIRFSRDRYLVRTPSVRGLETLSLANGLAHVEGIRSVSPNFIQTLEQPEPELPDLTDFSHSTVEPSLKRSSNQQWFQGFGDVQGAVRAMGQNTSSKLLPWQWHLNSIAMINCQDDYEVNAANTAKIRSCLNTPSTLQRIGTKRTDVRATEAWATGNTGEGTVVAIIDSMIQWDHPDLIERIYRPEQLVDPLPGETVGWDFADDDPNTGLDEADLAILRPAFEDAFSGNDEAFVKKYAYWMERLRKKNPNSTDEERITMLREFIANSRIASEFHGTHSAGVSLAGSSNNPQLLGVAPKAQLLPVKVSSVGPAELKAGVPSLKHGGNSISNVSIGEAIGYATTRGADVINMSLGSTQPSNFIAGMIETAQSSRPDLVFVASAGNGDCALRQARKSQVCAVKFPANQAGVLAVGASNLTGQRTNYSHFGPKLSVIAPGGDRSKSLFSLILTAGGTGSSAFWEGLIEPGVAVGQMFDPKGQYFWTKGTSFSSPAVAGVVALMKAEDPERRLSRERLMDILQQTSDRKTLTLSKAEVAYHAALVEKKEISPELSAEEYFLGNGLVNAEAAVAEVKRVLAAQAER